MKKIIICLSLAYLFQGCSEEEPATKFQLAKGFWVPYEAVAQDGTVNHGPFSTEPVFGSSAGSVRIMDDNAYVPVVWYNKDTYSLDIHHQGTYAYDGETQRLTFKTGNPLSSFAPVYRVIRHEEEEIWLEQVWTGTSYKVRLEVKE